MVRYKPPHVRVVEIDHATIEHLIPRSEGSTDDIENVRIACSFCNNLRGTKQLPWFHAFIDDLRKRTTFVVNLHRLRPREQAFVRTLCERRYQHWLRKTGRRS